MTKEIRMTNAEATRLTVNRVTATGFRHLGFVIPSSLGVSSFVIFSRR